jgi:hypothetical protein
MNSTGTATVAAYFSRQTDAEDAIRDLKRAGFSHKQIGLVLASGRDSSSSSTANTSATTATHQTGKVTSQAAAKAESVWERLKDFFTGGDIEPYADERDRGSPTAHEIIDPDAATSTQSGSGDSKSSGRYVHADVSGSLTGLGIPENQARYLASKLRSRSYGAIVTVNAGPLREQAEHILTSRGGDLGTNATSQDYVAGEYTANQPASGTANPAEQQQQFELSEQDRVEFLGEVLRLHKERIQRGEVRILEEVAVLEPAVPIPVSREEVVVESVPIDQNTLAQGEIGSNQSIRPR